MGDAFCLKWNNHQTTLVSVFDKLFECESLVDCTLAAEGRQLKAHKVVLSACSPYLEELIKNHEDRHPIIIFNSIRYDELKSILEYMYRGEVNVSQDQLDSFLKLAESLKIKGLTDHGGGGEKRLAQTKDDPRYPEQRMRGPSSVSSEEKEHHGKAEGMKPEPAEETNSLDPMEDCPPEEDEEDYGPPGAGTSQGSFSNHDFNNWSTASDLANDEVFMNTQHDMSNPNNTPQDMSVRPHICTGCGKSYLRRKHLSRHMNQECGSNRGRYPCLVCPKSYSRKEHLFRHNLFKHSGLHIEKGKPGRKPGRPRKSEPPNLVSYFANEMKHHLNNMPGNVDVKNHLPSLNNPNYSIPTPPELLLRNNSLSMFV